MSVREKILKEAKRIQEDALYSAKGHLVAASRWSTYHLRIGVPSAILATISGASALTQFDYHSVVAGSLALVTAALVAVSTFLNPNEKANCHSNAGNQYLSLRNSVRFFAEIEYPQINDDAELTKRLRALVKRRDNLNQTSPQIPSWAYEKAKKGIRAGEAQYEVDA